jgi:hypothetical protein
MTILKRLILAAAICLAASAAAAGTITDVRFQNTGAAQVSAPVTFGQVFAVGDMKKTDVLVGKLDGAAVPLQVDVKATHADGSVRHAIISAIVPKLAAGATGTMTLATGGTVVASTVKPADLLAAGFTASASATIAGVKYSASADQLLKGAKSTWLAGAVANEWQVVAPLATAAGVNHPHLTARFAVRYYSAVKKARVDVTIENDWAYEPGPQNFIYDAEILVGGKSVYAKAGLNHLHHARWRKLFWWGGDAPAVNVQSNVPYLISSKAVPNYDQATTLSPVAIAKYGDQFAAPREPMALGLSSGYMPTTGAEPGIGLLPEWTSAYVLTMDQRARDATLITGDLAGSYSMHYRDKNTDRPVSLKNYPYMTLVTGPDATLNPATKQYEAFPACAGDCASPYTHDTPHQPSLAYVPYLLTGDYFYLEEMQFWAMYDVFASNPGYRDFAKGILQSDQVRGQAWELRTLAHAAYITPDADSLKSDFAYFLDSNFDWYIDTYVNKSQPRYANDLGVITNGFALSYDNGRSIGPWQDDFFTAALGHAAELGFTKAATLMMWKAKSPVGRMTAPGVCWTDAAKYSRPLRDSDSSPFYSTWAQVQLNTRGAEFGTLPCGGAASSAILGTQVGDMGQLSDYYMGYPSNMQPALAYSVDSGIDGSKKSWDLFQSRTIKPDNSLGAQFNIVPRGYVATTLPAIPGGPLLVTPASPTVPAAPATLTGAPTVAGTWANIGGENSTITVPADTIVRYGASGKYVYAKVSGKFVATNEYFGSDPVKDVAKTVEAFTATPAVKPGKVTTPGNVKLKKLTGLTLTFFDAATFAPIKVLTGLTANSTGAITISDAALIPGATYGVKVADTSGKVIDMMYPITVQ